jgi:hypothetical protein
MSLQTCRHCCSKINSFVATQLSKYQCGSSSGSISKRSHSKPACKAVAVVVVVVVVVVVDNRVFRVDDNGEADVDFDDDDDCVGRTAFALKNEVIVVMEELGWEVLTTGDETTVKAAAAVAQGEAAMSNKKRLLSKHNNKQFLKIVFIIDLVLSCQLTK